MSQTGTQEFGTNLIPSGMLLVNFSQTEKERLMTNVMSLSPELRESALLKAIFLDKKISIMRKDRSRRGRLFFTDEMASNEYPDPRSLDGGNSWEKENQIAITLQAEKVWTKSQEMKQILIVSPEKAVRCEICGHLIDRERVEEVPHTRHCTACKNKSHNGHSN